MTIRIKPQPHTAPVALRVKVPADLHAQLDKYRVLLGPKTQMDYVVIEALRAFLKGDREFKQRLNETEESPAREGREPRPRPPGDGGRAS
jgi:hypothetical protein